MGKPAPCDLHRGRIKNTFLRSLAALTVTVAPLLLTTACKKPAKPVPASTPVAAPSSGAPTTAPAAAVPPAAPQDVAAGVGTGPGATLTYVGEAELPSLPSFFDPEGRFVGLPEKGANEEKDSCRIWDITERAFVGKVPIERCESWRRVTCLLLPGLATGPSELRNSPYNCLHTQAGERTLTTADKKTVVRWMEAAISIERDGSTNKLRAGCEKKGACPRVIAVALSPDDKQLAMARSLGTRIYVIDLETGKVAKTLKLGDAQVALPELLGWGPNGIAALVGVRSHSEDSGALLETPDKPDEAAPAAEKPAPPSEPEEGPDHPNWISDVQLVTWKTPTSKLKLGAFQANHNEVDGGSVTMDPFGRHIFLVSDGRRSASTLAVFDVEKSRELAHYAMDDGGEEDGCGGTELREPRWIPGTWPILETVAVSDAECTAHYTAWRVITAPGKRAATEIELKKEPDKKAIRVVKEDGVGIATLTGKDKQAAGPMPTDKIDPSKRWEATGKNSVKRLSDGEELIIEGKDCVHTAKWVFDCPLERFAPEVFLLDPDPLKGELVRGAQLAHLYYRPQLIDAFFDGKDVAPLVAAGKRVGLPPRLENQGVKYLDGQTPNLEVTVLAHDGGDGLSAIKIWLAKGVGPHIPAAPIPITKEQPTPVPLTLPPTTCDQVLVVACNAGGQICSKPVQVPFCPKKKHKLPAKTAG